MDNNQELLPRLLRDIGDGVLALDLRGKIMYTNEQCMEMLEVSEEIIGKSYASAFIVDDEGSTNDAFHQYILDAIYNKDVRARGVVPYRTRSGSDRSLRISSSYLRGAEEDENAGIVIIITDVTELDQTRNKYYASTNLFVATMCTVCFWVLLHFGLEFFGIHISTGIITQMVHLAGFILFFFVRRQTPLTTQEMGLSTKNLRPALVTNIIISIVGLALMVVAKIILINLNVGYFPEGVPFVDWSQFEMTAIIYPATVVMQEFLTRGVVHENLRRIFSGKHREVLALLVSSLIFSVLHVHMGFAYMIGAGILLSGLGALYLRHKTIWGVCVTHYVLGIAGALLGWL